MYIAVFLRRLMPFGTRCLDQKCSLAKLLDKPQAQQLFAPSKRDFVVAVKCARKASGNSGNGVGILAKQAA